MQRLNVYSITLLLIFVCLLTNLAEAGGFRKSGTAAAQFLKIGVGARALALSGSFAAIADDASALYWNPAGLATVENISWTGSYTKWFADITHQFSGLVVPVGNSSTLGFSATFITMDEVEITTETNPQGTGYFWDASDIAVGLSFARWMTDRFSLGATIKYVNQKIWNESASTFAIDVGTYLDTQYKGIIVGMCFSNFGGNLQLHGRDLIRAFDPNPNNSLNAQVDTRLHTQQWPLPVIFRVGVACEVVGQGDNIITSDKSNLIVAVDGNHCNDDREKLNCGIEYSWNKLITLRAGYGFGYDTVDFTYGGGLQFNISNVHFQCDYAIAPYGELDTVHYITIGLAL